MPIVRNSFIQMSKLTNLKGRINYISSHARQENLYAVYETTNRKFWTELAKCNQEEFKRSGTDGKCIEARELIIALPESFVDYEPDKLLKAFFEFLQKGYNGIKLIDYVDISKNSYVVVTELPYENGDDNFRPDIVVLINGMPLSFVEVKRQNNREGILAERERMTRRFSNPIYRRFVNITQYTVFSNNNEYDDTDIEPMV